MEEPEHSCSILARLNLDDVEEVVQKAYHQDGSAGRPPRKPMGVFKALIVKRLQQVPSGRELYRRLWNDADMREICDLEAEQKPYHPSQLTRSRNRIDRSIDRQRSAVERVNSRLKEQLGLDRHRVRSLKNIALHALLCAIAMLLTTLAALSLKRAEKARSITLLGR